LSQCSERERPCLPTLAIPLAAPATSRRRERARPYVHKPPPPITVAFRLAYVATIAERFGAELQHRRAQAPKLPVVIIQDGAPELWTLMEEWLENFWLSTRFSGLIQAAA
jgi:hypothetical protein